MKNSFPFQQELPPLQEVDDKLYETIGERDLRLLRESYQQCKTYEEKREFLKMFYDAETKNLSIHDSRPVSYLAGMYMPCFVWI